MTRLRCPVQSALRVTPSTPKRPPELKKSSSNPHPHVPLRTRTSRISGWRLALRQLATYEASRQTVFTIGSALLGRSYWLQLRWLLGTKKALLVAKAVYAFAIAAVGGVFAVVMNHAREPTTSPKELRERLDGVTREAVAALADDLECALDIQEEPTMRCPTPAEWDAFVEAERTRLQSKPRCLWGDGPGSEYCPPSRHADGLKLRRHLRRLDMALRRPGGWTEEETRQAGDAAELTRNFVLSFAEEAKSSEEARTCLQETVERERSRHWPVFAATRDSLLRPQLGFDDAVRIARDVGQRLAPGLVSAAPEENDFGAALASYWARCAPIQPLVDALCTDLAEKHLGTASRGGLKALFRGAEKAVLKKQGEPERVRDVARGAVEFDTMRGVADAMDNLAKLADCGDIRILRVEDRLSSPTSGGWSDIKITVAFRGLAAPAELQLTHKYLGMVRAGMASHKSYAASRSADELLRVCGVTVPCP
eukprot:Hpha_TRINITY_DN15856_c0_g5::TRINITY_DN15856_c0_g5_i1::g.189951::m.189951